MKEAQFSDKGEESAMEKKQKISVVTPCYNEEENVAVLYQKVKEVFDSRDNYDYEHIFIDNASKDATVSILKEIAKKDKKVKIIVNTRNFGHIRSPFHGMLQANGDAVVSIAADLQDPPGIIGHFITKWEEGYKAVVAVKKQSEESKILFAIRKFYYNLISRLSEVDQIKNFTGFGLNIDLYRAVDAARHDLWRDDAAMSWTQQPFIDQLFSDYSDFLKAYAYRVLAPNPDVLAVSIQSASTLFGLKFAELVRQLAPRVFILFGGPDCFHAEGGLSILDRNWVDALCTGEGDEAMPFYLNAISANGMHPVEMKGFCHRRADGTVFDGGQPNPVMDLDILPFADFSGIDFNRYTLNNRICMMTSRGCILKCAYCSEGANFLRYRCRSPESLINEIGRHVGMLRKTSSSRPHINFSDSLINGRPEALERVCHLILERRIDFSWGGMALLRKEMSHDFLALMRQAGCVEVMWGMESGSRATLKLMRKKLFDPDLAERIVRDANSLGIDQFANIIVGFPGETEEQFNETTRFLKRMHPYFKSIGLPLMEIRRNSHVYANSDLYNVLDKEKKVEWETRDGANNVNIRLARRQILSDILAEKLFDQGRYRKFAVVSNSIEQGRYYKFILAPSIIEQAARQKAGIDGHASIEALTQLMTLYLDRLDLREAFGSIAGVNLTALGACPIIRRYRAHGACEARSRREEEAMRGHRRRRATKRSHRNPHAPFGFRLGGGICCVGAPRR
jgi:radical SAM superfamily enzyme YgiQ (UPF0313 family)